MKKITRADMSASWLAQMGWDVHVLDGLQAGDFKHIAAANGTAETLSRNTSADAADAADVTDASDATHANVVSAPSVSPRQVADWLCV